MEESGQKTANRKNPESGKEVSPIFLRLFGLPFFLIGIGFFLWGLSMLFTWHQSGSWPKAKATILSAQMHTSRGSKGGNTYSVTGSYEYSYNDQLYTGNKIEIETGSSSAFGEKQEMLQIMEQAMQSKTQLDVFVNPADPKDAFLFRHISMGMVLITGIGGLFAMVGSLFIFGLIPGLLLSGIDKKKLKSNPDEPWLADSRWQGFVIKTSNWKDLIGLWGVAIFMTIFISIFVTVMIMDNNTPLFAWLIISVFVIVMIIIDYSAVYKTLQYCKFHESTLILGQFPLCGGSEFSAVMAVAERFSAGQDFNFELVCERKKVTGSGKNAKTSVDVLFKSAHRASAMSENFRNRAIFVPVRIPVPAQCPETTPESSNPAITWKLKSSASIPGVDFAAEFPLPVYVVSNPDLIKYKN